MHTANYGQLLLGLLGSYKFQQMDDLIIEFSMEGVLKVAESV